MPGARLLLLDALAVPDLEVARRWVKRLMCHGQSRHDIAKFVASQSVNRFVAEDYSYNDQESSEEGLSDLCEMTLYWSTSESVGFSEEQTAKEWYQANGCLVHLKFPLEPSSEGYSAIRFDISNRKGAYAVEKLFLSGEEGQPLWFWSGNEIDIECLSDAEIVCSSDDGATRQVGFVATGDDPQFRLRVDEDVLAQLSKAGGRCDVVLRAFV